MVVAGGNIIGVIGRSIGLFIQQNEPDVRVILRDPRQAAIHHKSHADHGIKAVLQGFQHFAHVGILFILAVIDAEIEMIQSPFLAEGMHRPPHGAIEIIPCGIACVAHHGHLDAAFPGDGQMGAVGEGCLVHVHIRRNIKGAAEARAAVKGVRADGRDRFRDHRQAGQARAPREGVIAQGGHARGDHQLALQTDAIPEGLRLDDPRILRQAERFRAPHAKQQRGHQEQRQESIKPCHTVSSSLLSRIDDTTKKRPKGGQAAHFLAFIHFSSITISAFVSRSVSRIASASSAST